jgi:methyl-accepting chemotaxis protein
MATGDSHTAIQTVPTGDVPSTELWARTVDDVYEKLEELATHHARLARMTRHAHEQASRARHTVEQNTVQLAEIKESIGSLRLLVEELLRQA